VKRLLSYDKVERKGKMIKSERENAIDQNVKTIKMQGYNQCCISTK